MDDVADERWELWDEPDDDGPPYPLTDIPDQMTELSTVMTNVL